MPEGDQQPKATPVQLKPRCGIIMPISAIDGLSADHWLEVLNIFKEACIDAGFDGELVSTTDEVSIIQKTIIDNLYNNEMVICDISGKNQNVMIELGIRLTFDKPTIIVTDDLKSLPFDTSMIQHLLYPRDLRFTKVVEFKKRLAEKIIATHEKKKADPDFSPFLKHFGQFITPRLQQKEVSENQYIMDKLQSMETTLANLYRNNNKTRYYHTITEKFEIQVSIDQLVHETLNRMIQDNPSLTVNGIQSDPDIFKKFLYYIHNQIEMNKLGYELMFSKSEIGEFVKRSLLKL